MSTKTYLGIDYGLGRTNINNETGIRFGVISQNSVMPEAVDDCWLQGRDLTYEAAVEAFKREIAGCETGAELRSIVREHCGHRVFQGDLDGIAVGDVEAIWNEVEEHFNNAYAYSMADCDRDWLYERDGYKIQNCLQSDLMILESPFYTYAQFCSPCVPGACNLDCPLVTPPDSADGDWQALRGNRCYCLGHDWFDGGRAPYPVYSVATGDLVER